MNKLFVKIVGVFIVASLMVFSLLFAQGANSFASGKTDILDSINTTGESIANGSLSKTAPKSDQLAINQYYVALNNKDWDASTKSI